MIELDRLGSERELVFGQFGSEEEWISDQLAMDRFRIEQEVASNRDGMFINLFRMEEEMEFDGFGMFVDLFRMEEEWLPEFRSELKVLGIDSLTNEKVFADICDRIAYPNGELVPHELASKLRSRIERIFHHRSSGRSAPVPVNRAASRRAWLTPLIQLRSNR